MTTADLLEAIRADIKRELRDELMVEIKPAIERQLYANIFTIEEAAAYLRVCKRTVSRMAADGEIPYFMQRNRPYFRQLDLDRNIEQRIVKGRAKHAN